MIKKIIIGILILAIISISIWYFFFKKEEPINNGVTDTDTLNTPTDSAPPRPMSQTLTIDKAIYGASGKEIDVKTILSQYMNNNSINIPSNGDMDYMNKLFSYTVPTTPVFIGNNIIAQQPMPTQLTVDYKVGTTQSSKTFKGADNIIIP